MTRRGPGLLLRDLLSGQDARIEAAIAVIAQVRPDVLVLTGFDTDLDQVALGALGARLAGAGLDVPYLLSPLQNAGRMTALDLDGDGRLGTPEDALGYGRFAGARSMAILSRHPVVLEQDMSGFLWADLPGSRLGEVPPDVRAIQTLSSTAHWIVRVDWPRTPLRLLTWSATPPMFGAGDRNLRRNHDEAAFWTLMLDGALPWPAPAGPFVVLGLGNTDPEQGAGDKAAIGALLAHPALQEGPSAPNFHSERQSLRLSYLLPSSGIVIRDMGTFDTSQDEALAQAILQASRHRLIWADLTFP